MPFEKDPNELGVLWEKSGRNGTYFTGSLELPDGTKQPVVVFKNGNKKDGSKAPDWRILKPQKRDDTPAIDGPPF
jgi:hypothetical protein